VCSRDYLHHGGAFPSATCPCQLACHFSVPPDTSGLINVRPLKNG
jgi:hypothetical protein